VKTVSDEVVTCKAFILSIRAKLNGGGRPLLRAKRRFSIYFRS